MSKCKNLRPVVKKTPAAGCAVLLSVLLAGCGGQQLLYQGTEVLDVDEAVEALDQQWAAHQANGVAATVSDDSRCYLQKSEEVLADEAICGPIHYLGDDETTWDTATVEPVAGQKGTTLMFDSFSSEGERLANAEPYRPDGKEMPAEVQLEEPDTEAAAPLEAAWDVASVDSVEESADVVTPAGTVEVSGAKTSTRYGDASNRKKAPEGHTFVAFQIRNVAEASSSSGFGPSEEEGISDIDLAITTAGKSYPIGQAKSGTVVMAVPGDAADAKLKVTYDDLTQTVSAAGLTLDSTATAYYDGIQSHTSATTKKVINGEEDAEEAWYGYADEGELEADRTAYDEKLGWAPEGKAWLVVNATMPTYGPVYNGFEDGGRYEASYETEPTIASAKVSNVSGEAFEAKLKDWTLIESGGFLSDPEFRLTFEVPAGIADFTMDMTINRAGPKQSDSSVEVQPATASMDFVINGTQLSFSRN